jgi:hypothetical protein
LPNAALSFKQKTVLALHLFVTLLAWVAPFLFRWPLAVAAYTVVMLQFWVFQRCLMNAQHGLQESGDRIFYTDLLEKAGFRPDHRRLKFLVRRVLYPALALLSLLWQRGLGFEPLIF